MAGTEGRALRAVAAALRRRAVHAQRPGQHPDGVRRQVGCRAVAGTTGRSGAERLLRVTGRRRRQALLHQRRGRDVRGESGQDVRAAAREQRERARARVARDGRRHVVLPHAVPPHGGGQMIRRAILSAALAVAVIAGVSAQDKPNFAGKWKAAASFNSWTITVEGHKMTVTMTVAGNSESRVYLLDGTPLTTTVDGPNGPMENVSTSIWEGDVLVT